MPIDIAKLLMELRRELAHLDAAILSLERLKKTPPPTGGPKEAPDSQPRRVSRRVKTSLAKGGE